MCCIILKTFAKLALILAILVSMAACQKTTLQTKSDPLDRSLPDETSHKVKVSQFIDNRIEYHLEANKIERFHDRRMMYGYGVVLTTYDKDNRINSTIMADTTIVDDARNIIFANGNARMISKNGTLSTSKIVWDRAVDEITAPLKVKLVRGTDVLYGEKLRTNSTISFIEMDAVSAQGIVNPKELNW